MAILEAPGVNKNDLDIQAKDNTIRDLGPEGDILSGKRQRASPRTPDRNLRSHP